MKIFGIENVLSGITMQNDHDRDHNVNCQFHSYLLPLTYFAAKICQSTSKTGSESGQSYNVLLYMMNIVCHSVCGF